MVRMRMEKGEEDCWAQVRIRFQYIAHFLLRLLLLCPPCLHGIFGTPCLLQTRKNTVSRHALLLLVASLPSQQCPTPHSNLEVLVEGDLQIVHGFEHDALVHDEYDFWPTNVHCGNVNWLNLSNEKIFESVSGLLTGSSLPRLSDPFS